MGEVMRTIVTADLHLTARQQDAYRWDFLNKWLWEQDFNNLVILGDLTDEKDCHSSRLVNRIIDELTALAREGISIHLLKGNHDYIEAERPFFAFLSHFSNCSYYSETCLVEIGNARWAFFPHSREAGWGDLPRLKSVGIDFIGCHQIFSGALSASGISLSGFDAGDLRGVGRVWSGDVHVPQRVGVVEYVGAPYPVHFGDVFTPRVVLLDGEECRDLYPAHVQKLVLRITDPGQVEEDASWKPGDHVKIELSLSRADFGKWEKCRKKLERICKTNELVLCGIELKVRGREKPTLDSEVGIPHGFVDQFEAYVKHQKIDSSDALVGRGLL
jgi:hypothetical protein